MSEQSLIVCMFCGTREPRGKRGEDIISDWYAKEFHGPGDYTLDMADITAGTSERSIRSQTAATLRFADICQGCNNGWMALLERAAAPILRSMMHGEPAVLTRRECRLIAAWCQLKAVTLDARYPTRQLPECVAHSIARSDSPQYRLGVTLARYEPDPGRHVVIGRHSGAAPIERYMQGGQGDVLKAEIFRVTLAFSRFAFQVTTARDNMPPVEMLVVMGHPYWVGAWPPPLHRDDHVLTWPPPQTIEGLGPLAPFI